jgi:hypothetical protein
MYIIKIIMSRNMRWAGNVPQMRKKRNAYRILIGKPEGKRQLGISRRKWEAGETGLGVMDCTDLAHYRKPWRFLVKTVMNHQVP